MLLKQRSILPGFGLALGFTVLYLGLVVLIPLAALLAKAGGLTWESFWHAVTTPRVLAAYRLSLLASLAAAGFNLVMGSLVAWVLVRYSFPGRALVDALIDLPFALPTAVAGIALTTLYAPTGWLGPWLASVGLQAAYAPLGVVIALTFVSLPFVVRTVQPVLEELDHAEEEAATSLGASRWQTFRRVIFPQLWPALLTGFTLAFARSVGEYGSVVFISGNKPMSTEIVPLLIMTRLDEYDYAGAAALAVMMLGFSLVMLLALNLVQWWSTRRWTGVV